MQVNNPGIRAGNIKSFCKNVRSENILRGCSKEQLKKIATYIEEEFIPLINKNTHYIEKKKSHLAGTLEYDPATKKIFVHFTKEKIGEGWQKKGTYTILYDPEHPLPCIRLVLKDKRIKSHPQLVQKYSAEIGRSQKLQYNSSHIVRVITATKYKKGDVEKKAMIQELYTFGTLESLIKNNPGVLTAERKIKIAKGIIMGLKEVHEREYLHRDLHSGNIFVDKQFESYIGDFGWSLRASEVKGKQAQSNPQITAPELLCSKKNKPEDYRRGELFTAGLSLYHLSYGKELDFGKKKTNEKIFRVFSSKSSGSDKKKSVESLRKKINAKVSSDRSVLYEKREKQGEETLSLDEMLKYAALQLIHPDTKERMTTDYWIKFFERAEARVA